MCSLGGGGLDDGLVSVKDGLGVGSVELVCAIVLPMRENASAVSTRASERERTVTPSTLNVPALSVRTEPRGGILLLP